MHCCEPGCVCAHCFSRVVSSTCRFGVELASSHWQKWTNFSNLRTLPICLWSKELLTCCVHSQTALTSSLSLQGESTACRFKSISCSLDKQYWKLELGLGSASITLASSRIFRSATTMMLPDANCPSPKCALQYVHIIVAVVQCSIYLTAWRPTDD